MSGVNLSLIQDFHPELRMKIDQLKVKVRDTLYTLHATCGTFCIFAYNTNYYSFLGWMHIV